MYIPKKKTYKKLQPFRKEQPVMIKNYKSTTKFAKIYMNGWKFVEMIRIV